MYAEFLKIWSYFVSLLVGFIFGILYLFVVSKCRQRFRKHRGRVTICASVALSIISALVFYQGMYVVDSVWVSVTYLLCHTHYISMSGLTYFFLSTGMGHSRQGLAFIFGIFLWLVGSLFDNTRDTIL